MNSDLNKILESIAKTTRSMNEQEEVYTTDKVDADYTASEEEDKEGVYIRVSKVNVKWALEIESRNWGIKSFNPRILEVSGRKEIEKEDSPRTEEEFFTVDAKDYDVNIESIPGYGFVPINISIDNQRKTINATFAVGMGRNT